MRPLLFKEVENMPEYQDWQHASLLNRLIANVSPEMVGGYYGLEISLTARELDELSCIALTFDALARSQGGPPIPEDPGGD